jgi:acyl-CoA reductase-like NAD-dependent aldehyde dehydrogenase
MSEVALALAPSHDRPVAYLQTIGGSQEDSPTSFAVIDPALDAPFADCPDATRDQLERAVAAARGAFPAWSRTPIAERRGRLKAFAQALRDQAETMAVVLTREQGKPLAQARMEIAVAAKRIDELVTIDLSPEILRDDTETRTELRYRALGVVGAITPWNVPVSLATAKIVQALYTGNTVVLKPSPFTPLTTLMLGTIGLQHFPPGVLNVLAGGNDLGRWITDHPDIAKISFTGSGPTGKAIMVSAAKTLKRLTLELGGNDPAIVLADANIDVVAPKLVQAGFSNCGQICMAVKRVYAHADIYDRLAGAMAKLAGGWKLGPGLGDGVQIGPVQNRPQYDKVLGILAETRAIPGVRILTGGEPVGPGYFLAPTLVADIEDGTTLVDDEQFGPILPLVRFTDLDALIDRLNAGKFGLSASVWTSNPEAGVAVAGRLDVGTAWINKHGGADNFAPFGGAKESGLGREYSVLGLKAYMEAHVVTLARA